MPQGTLASPWTTCFSFHYSEAGGAAGDGGTGATPPPPSPPAPRSPAAPAKRLWKVAARPTRGSTVALPVHSSWVVASASRKRWTVARGMGDCQAMRVVYVAPLVITTRTRFMAGWRPGWGMMMGGGG